MDSTENHSGGDAEYNDKPAYGSSSNSERPAGPRHELFIGGLSYSTTSDTLRNKFEEIGEVMEALVISDRETKRSKGFGFVKYGSEEYCRSAIERLNHTELDGRTIRVENAADPNGSRSRGPRTSNYSSPYGRSSNSGYGRSDGNRSYGSGGGSSQYSSRSSYSKGDGERDFSSVRQQRWNGGDNGGSGSNNNRSYQDSRSSYKGGRDNYGSSSGGGGGSGSGSGDGQGDYRRSSSSGHGHGENKTSGSSYDSKRRVDNEAPYNRRSRVEKRD